MSVLSIDANTEQNQQTSWPAFAPTALNPQPLSLSYIPTMFGAPLCLAGFRPNLYLNLCLSGLPETNVVPVYQFASTFADPLQSVSSGSFSTTPSPSPSPEKAAQLKRLKLSIVLLDWDDTLFPTTAIVHQKQDVSVTELQRLGKLLYDTVVKYGSVYGESNVYIVTNAAKDWPAKSLQLCSSICRKKIKPDSDLEHELQLDYFSALQEMLVQSDIHVVSAQAMYCEQHRQNPALWKIKAFKQITIEHFKNIKGSCSGDDILFEIVSIGDSDNEFVASFEAKYKLNKFIKRRKSKNCIIRLHRIKLRKKPTVQEMINQCKLMIDEAAEMHSEPGSVTICYE